MHFQDGAEMGLLILLLMGMGTHQPALTWVVIGMGDNCVIEGGNGIRVTYSKPALLPSIQNNTSLPYKIIYYQFLFKSYNVIRIYIIHHIYMLPLPYK